MKKILLVLLAVCLIVGLAACNDNTEVYSITFNTLGGGENIEVVLDGSTELVFPDDPEKQGYDFKGWFYDKDVWEQPVSLAIIKQTGIAQNTEIYAKWEEKPPVVIEEPDPDVNFNTYGGTEVQGLTGVEQITQAPQTSKTGYSFLGWFLSLDDTQPVLFPFIPQQDTTLHAKWHLVNYSVTYNLDGGDASNPETYNIESGTVTLAPATRPGYTFQGWYSDSAFVTPVTEFSSEATGNLHFFAKWEINTYKLKYYLDGDIYTVEEEPVELSFKYGAHITDTIGMLIKEGNSFSGWKLNDGSEIPAVMPATDLNVYGRFSPLSYTVYYYVDDVFLAAQSVPFGTAINYREAPQKLNSRFSGWTYEDGDTLPQTMPASDIEIRGLFTDTFQIIYKLDGQEYQKETYVFGEPVEAIDDPQKTGYSFSGWEGLPATMPATDLDVTGRLLPNVYRLYFSAPQQDATVTGIPPVEGQSVDYIEVRYDENFIYRLNEVEGELFAFDFAGWQLDGDSFAPAKWEYTEDVTVSASWTEKRTQGLKYTMSTDGTYSVTGYSGLSTEVFIPSDFNGVTVQTIAQSAFRNNTAVTSITIHNGITRLGNHAFQNCTALTVINLPLTVQNIDAETFFGCSSLQNFTIPAGVSIIGNAPFRGCTSLSEIAVAPDNTIYKAEDGVLYSIDGKSLIQYPEGKTASSFIIPSSVETLGNYAFYNCQTLAEIQLGANITSVGCYAFAGTSISSMVLSKNVTWIGSNAFDRCSQLVSLSLPFVGSSKAEAGTSEGLFGYIFGNSYFADSVSAYQWYDALHYVRYYLPSSLVSVTLTDTQTIPYGAFSGCKTIQDIVLTRTVSIGEKAFYRCSALQSVSLPRTLTTIDTDAFNSCTSLQNLTLPLTVTSIGEFAFHNCPDLVYDYEQAGASEGDYTYVQVNSEGTDAVYLDSFVGVPGINQSIPEMFGTSEVVSIGKAFSGIAGMYTITLPFGVTSLDRNAFAGCGYLVVYARNVAKPIDWEEQWDDVKIYWNTDSVINYINYEGTNLNFYITNNEAILTRYTGTDADVTIPEMVFTGQSVVPVTTIGKYAFAGNPHVQSVIVPDSVSNIEEAAFADCQALIDITVYPSNMYYRIDNGVLYNKSGTRLIQYPAGRSNMMDGTTKMYPDFTLPSTVESIASMAFAGVNLETVTFSNVFNELGAGAFMNCDELTDVIYLNMTNITAIPQKAFFGCASLATLTLPTAIRSIADSAFDGCLQLANMNGEQGLDFSDFLYLTSIGNRAFANCASLPSVLFSSSLARIGYSAFQNCASLTTIEMPDSVLAVGNAAFSGCVGLTSAKLSSKLTAVSSLMFYDCGNLVSLTIPFIGAAGYTQETEDAVLGYLFGYTKESGVVGTVQYYGEGAEDQATYFIPEGLSYVFVTNAALIPYGAFSNISTLTEVEIADTVSEISGKAFLGCNTLESLTIPFIGANRDATSNEAVLGYLFAETDSSDPMGIRQEYGEGQEGYYLIPSTLRSITVTDATAIGYGALYQLANLIQVSFNANIVSIGENSLYGCNALETLEIPFVGFARHAEGAADAVFGYLFGYSQTNEAGTVRQYYNTDESAYYYIPATLTEVTITSADLIPYGAFMNTAIASIQINDGAEELGEKAFAGNMLIQEIVLPNSLLTIRDYAFDNCLLLAFVSLNRVQTIGDYVFRGTAVQALTIPDSVTEVGEGAFSSMTALQTVSLSVYNSNLVTIGSYAFEGDTALETIALPNRLTSIGASLFKDCSALWRVSLPYLGADRNALGTPESMFGYVFNTAPAAGFDAITQTTTEGDITYYIPSSLTTLIITSATRIGAGALSGIGDLSISLNEGITIIEEKAFYGAQITSLHLPASVTILQESAFESSSITQMTFTIGSALTTICEKAFFNAALTSFAVPAGVVTIGESAFQNELFSLTSVTFATAAVLETIGRDAFEGNISLTSVTLPASLKFIENSAFENCSALSSLLFASGASLQSIGTYAFAHTALDIVNLPQTTQELGDYAFAYTTLTAIGFGTESNLKVLGDYAFAYSQLQTLTIPSGVTYVGINPFYETPVANLNLTGYQSGYKVESGVLYTKDGSVLISYPQSLEADTFAVPDGVARIDAYAFASNPYLITLSLPSDLLSIGYSAFMDCTALDTVSFRGDAKLLVIEEEAFYGCTALRIFDAPSTLVRIENSAFRNTEALTAIDLSACDALAYLGEYAFEQSGILTATLPATLAVMGKGAFKNASNLTAINLHNTDLVTVEEESFYGCVNLLSIEFPSTLETVSTNAFANCDLLSSASFAQTSLSTIGEGAFDDTALVSVALPDSLQLIGQNAFDNCTSLTAVTVPFIGLTTTAQNEEARLSYVFGNSIVRIASVTVRNTQTDIAVNADAFQGMTALASLTLSDGVTTIAEGALADCPIQSLDLIFVGATATATGANAVLGYLFGFAAVPDAFTIQQDINETESVYAYIPATLTDVTVQNAPDYGAFSNITSLQSVTVRGGDILGKNLIAGCTALETLTVPFAGASADATGANSALTYITGSALPALTTLKITATSVLTAETLPLGFPIQTLEIGGNLSSLPQGLLANCPNLVHLMIPFAGASSTATGQDALFGYLYGFAATPTTTTVEQYYGEEASEVAYSEIPASLTSIVLTDNSDIGYGAFYNMSELRNLTLNAEVSIGQKAFYNCVRLQSISIGGNAKIMSVGAYAFYGAAFESVTISADVETIGAYAFAGCDNLVSVSFETGSHLKYVHEYAFANCTALQNIALPDGTQSVGANAFDHCSALSSAVIPSTVTEMGAALFKDCPNLVSLSLPFAGPDDTAVPAQHKLGYLFDESSSNVNVPLSLQTLHITDASFLADGALQDTHLTALFLNEGLLIIEESAVRNVPLQSITIPSTVLVVNKYAFANTAIQSLSFAANSVLHTLGDNAFDGCVSLGDVVLPDSVTSIGSAVFAGCLLNIRFSVPFIGATRAATGANAVLGYFFGTSGSGVTQKYAVDQTGIFAIPASLMNIMVTSATSIGYGAFSGCGAIRNISINNGVNTIGALALEGCISLESLILPFVGESANSVDTKARMQHVFGLGVNSGIHHVETVSITSAITIASGAFHGMTGLKTVSINNVTSIAQGVFEGCMALEDLTVPFIGAQSFHNNNDMLLLGYWFKSVAPSASGAVGQPYGDGPTEIAYAEIPTGIHRITVTHASKIGYGALSYLTELTSVSMNNGVSEIGKNALKGSYNIESLTVPFIGLSRNATSNAAKITYMFGSSPSNLTVVNVTDAIRLSTLAFASNTKITTITLDGNITSIDNNAFSGLTALTQITIPASVTTIGESAFEGCTSLVSVTFAQDTALTVIGEDAFKNTAILSLTIPSTVTSIGESILEGCNNLETLTIPYIGASADATEQEALLGYVFGLSQTSSMQTTTQIYNDNNDAVYTVFPDNLYQLTVTSATEIGYGALHNCSSITELSLNSGITDIGRYAFSNCVNLTSIVVPDSVNTIGSAAFSGCASLESMTLPFAGTNRTDTGAIALFGYIFGTVSNGSPGATVQYFNAVSSRTYYIPSTLNTIVITSAAKLDYGVFYNLSGVTSITLNEGISAIPAKAFYQCSSVVSLVIPDTVTSIEGGALEGMNSLVSLTVPFVGASAAATGVQSQFGYIFGEAQEYGPNVMKQSIFIGDTEVNTLFRIPFALRDVTLTGITAIKDYAFYNCSNIATVSVTEGITAIGDYAFANASSLSAIYADFAALITIGDSAFENCRSFLGIDLSQASLLEQLGTRAFWGCSSLSYVNLPAGLNNVPLDAFGGI